MKNLEMNRMIEENKGLVYMVMNKNYKGFILKNPQLEEDLIQIGMIALFNSIKLYDESKGFKFSSFACTNIKNAMYNFCKNESTKYLNRDGDKSVDETIDGSEEKFSLLDTFGVEEDFSNIEASEILEFVKSQGEKVYYIAYYLSEGYTMQQIGERIGMSKQNVSVTVSKLRELLIKKFDIKIAEEIDVNVPLVAFNEEGFEQRFDNPTEASKVLGINISTIRRHLRDKNTRAKNTCKNREDKIKVSFKLA